jgi:hypothetical protein
MGTLLITDNINTTSTPGIRHGNKLLKLIMLAFVLVSITLMSSCFVGGPPPRMGHVRSVEINDSHDNGNHGHQGGGHHDNGRHHGHDK